MAEGSNNETPEIKRVMGIFAHPDDPEFFAGGTFARWASEGAHITFVLATSGDKGSGDPTMTHERLVEIREVEERNAAAALGVKEVIFLRFPDGELEPNLELRRAITRLIRMKQPDTVVTCDPTVFYTGDSRVNHPDHRAIGAATLAAVYPAARDRLNFLELERDEGLAPYKVRNLYISGAPEPNKAIDITDHIETKIDSLRCHVSQIKDIEEVAKWLRERYIDPRSPAESPRLIEQFRVITLS